MKKLLIVDDDNSIIDGLAKMASHIGPYDIKTTVSGLFAIDIIKQYRPEIIITDFILPQFNGMQLLELCQKEFPKIQVILATGFPTSEFIQSAMKKGAIDILKKPFRREDLQKSLLIAEKLLNLSTQNSNLKNELEFLINKPI